jgi:hypothetical protein
METVPGVDEVVSRDAPIPIGEFDCHCPFMSLPLIFGTRVGTIPQEIPHMFVPDRLRAQWADRMAGVDAFRVGLVWAGRREFPQNEQRSVRLAQYSPLFDLDGVAFFSLQKGPDAGQVATLGRPIFDWTGDCRDILDTAALMENLDLVISVCTSVAHLAGALGRPVWLLNRFQSEWRWMLGREDSPWYPTMRIFRQKRPGDWEDVIERIAAALRVATPGRARPPAARRPDDGLRG